MSVDKGHAYNEVSVSPYPKSDKYIGASLAPEKRQFRQIALEAALKLASVAEPEKRVIERARVIFDFLYGEEAK